MGTWGRPSLIKEWQGTKKIGECVCVKEILKTRECHRKKEKRERDDNEE